MNVVSLTSELAQRFSIPESCRESLGDALRRIAKDGADALSRNIQALETTKLALSDCERCVANSDIPVWCVDGDAWEKTVHAVAPSGSVDIGLVIGEEDHLVLLPIEGKLGMACDYPGDRAGPTIRQCEMEAKVDGLRTLVPSCLPVRKDLIIVVPRNGQEWAWHSVRRWNLAGNRIGRMFSCCLSDLAMLLGLSVSSRPNACQGTLNEYRSARLKSEFEQSGTMSRVQLPSAGFCTGCRKCRDACPRKAIALIPDEQGRFYPFIDNLSCKTGCRHCETQCPILQGCRTADTYVHSSPISN